MNTPILLALLALVTHGTAMFFWKVAGSSRSYGPSYMIVESVAYAAVGVAIHLFQRQRFDSSAKIQFQYDCICVLKGAGTLVATEGGDVWLCKEGNPGMATAGMGDVLSGVIGALLCQGLVPRDAAIVGVWLHSRAADLAVVDDGERGLLASDLSDYLRRLVNDPYSG